MAAWCGHRLAPVLGRRSIHLFNGGFVVIFGNRSRLGKLTKDQSEREGEG